MNTFASRASSPAVNPLISIIKEGETCNQEIQLEGDDAKYTTGDLKPGALGMFFRWAFRSKETVSKNQAVFKKVEDDIKQAYGEDKATKFIAEFQKKKDQGSPLTKGALMSFLEDHCNESSFAKDRLNSIEALGYGFRFNSEEKKYVKKLSRSNPIVEDIFPNTKENKAAYEQIKRDLTLVHGKDVANAFTAYHKDMLFVAGKPISPERIKHIMPGGEEHEGYMPDGKNYKKQEE